MTPSLQDWYAAARPHPPCRICTTPMRLEFPSTVQRHGPGMLGAALQSRFRCPLCTPDKLEDPGGEPQRSDVAAVT